MRLKAGCGWLIASIAAIVVVVATAGCRDVDVVTASYASMAEARDDGAMASGALPPGVPEGAYEIRTASDLRSDRRWGLFNFEPQDADALRAILHAEDATFDRLTCDIPARIEWWPVLLRGTVDAEQAKAAGLLSYRSRQGSLIFVVNWDQGRAYYWSGDARKP
jgi:hypothetical protein